MSIPHIHTCTQWIHSHAQNKRSFIPVCLHSHAHAHRDPSQEAITLQYHRNWPDHHKWIWPVCVGGYFQNILCMLTTTNPLVGQCVCDCIHLQERPCVWQCEHAYVSVSAEKSNLCVSVCEKGERERTQEKKSDGDHSHMRSYIFWLWACNHWLLVHELVCVSACECVGVRPAPVRVVAALLQHHAADEEPRPDVNWQSCPIHIHKSRTVSGIFPSFSILFLGLFLPFILAHASFDTFLLFVSFVVCCFLVSLPYNFQALTCITSAI